MFGLFNKAVEDPANINGKVPFQLPSMEKVGGAGVVTVLIPLVMFFWGEFKENAARGQDYREQQAIRWALLDTTVRELRLSILQDRMETLRNRKITYIADKTLPEAEKKVRINATDEEINDLKEDIRNAQDRGLAPVAPPIHAEDRH